MVDQQYYLSLITAVSHIYQFPKAADGDICYYEIS